MSLVEVLVAMSILSIGVLGFIGAFTYITKSIRVSRAGTLATNLAQEKIENLKNFSYYKLALSTVIATNNDFSPPINYDETNYSLEVINIGGISFKRAVLVSMAQIDNGLISSLGYNYPDTGMKKVTVYVMWQHDSRWKSVKLENVYENPVVDPLSGQMSGDVTDGAIGIGGALVRIVENSDWSDIANSAGAYSLTAQPGTYSVRASSSGYHDQLLTNVYLSSTTVTDQDFVLTPISTGTIEGHAWTNPNLLISHIALSTFTVVGNGVQNTKVEFLQLFNPTTFQINIGNDIDGPATTIDYYAEYVAENQLNILTDGAYINYVSTYVDPLHYYLIASASFFWFGDQYINADAHYNGTKLQDNDSGAWQLTRVWDGHVWDLVGWSDGNSAPRFEGDDIDEMNAAGDKPPQCAGDSIEVGWTALRMSTPADVNDAYGPAYDTGDNDADFLGPDEICQLISPMIAVAGLRNTSFSAVSIISGVPMYGAYVTADDLLGPAVTASEVTISSNIFGTTVTLTSKSAYFSLAGVSTGTWNVVVASGVYSATISSVVVESLVSTSIVNGSTDPTWKVENWFNVHLETMSTDGYISGTVTDVSGDVIVGAEILAGGTTKTTGANGRYFVKVSSGEVFVIGNPNNVNPTYVESVQSATVQTGVLTVVDFTLTEGGVITGFASTDGTSILPNVQFAASIDGAQYGLGTSDVSGNFYIKNLSTGTYDVAPILDPLETYSPLNLTASVTPAETVSVGTFTISGSLGTLAGTVKNNNELVTSGALILVSVDAIPATPNQIVASSSPAQTPLYAASSLAAGTYEVEVRGSTSSTYNVSVYVPTISGSAVTVTTKTYSGINITAGNQTTLNIAVP